MYSKNMVHLIGSHLERYPLMEMRDIYKLLYQSIMGPAHLFANEENAFLSLEKEFDNAEQSYEKSVFIDISLEQEIVRINIPVFKRYGSPQQLWEMLLETRRKIKPDKEKLKSYWIELKTYIENGHISKLHIENWDNLNTELHQRDFPSLSHSKLYKTAYKPSYRVVLKELV
ncbi:MAG: hypothetical protein JW794_08285 [Candidatus Cloacimonetes bacterium]|nr:hypothetical protein [Candidatus Cloacimonadota bacterium]